VSTPEDTPLDIVLTGSDVDGDKLTYTLVSSPTHGTIEGVAPNLTYTPDANTSGADSFSFVVNDSHVNSEPAVVSIEVTPVNDAPVADSQAVSTVAGAPIDIVLTGSDPNDDELTFTVVSNPTHGTLTGVAPNLTYTPEPGYAGLDDFTFTVNDGTLDSAAAEVRITIRYVVYVPVIFR
jgi:hypothetical protein